MRKYLIAMIVLGATLQAQEVIEVVPVTDVTEVVSPIKDYTEEQKEGLEIMKKLRAEMREKARIEAERQKAEAERIAREKKLAEEKRLAELKKIEEQKRIEAERIAAEKKKAEEALIAKLEAEARAKALAAQKLAEQKKKEFEIAQKIIAEQRRSLNESLDLKVFRSKNHVKAAAKAFEVGNDRLAFLKQEEAQLRKMENFIHAKQGEELLGQKFDATWKEFKDNQSKVKELLKQNERLKEYLDKLNKMQANIAR